MEPVPEDAASPGTRDFTLLVAPLQRIATECASTAMEAVMRRADDYLFDRSGQGSDGTELTALRDLRRARGQITQRFSDLVVSGFRQLLDSGLPGQQDLTELSLLSEDGLEEQLATEQMVDSLARQHAVALELLEQRMAVMVGRPVLAPAQNPAGPPFLADSMRTALHSVELSTPLRITLYKFMERELSSVLRPLYDRMNASLTGAGILPRLLPSKSAIERTAANAAASVPGNGTMVEAMPADAVTTSMGSGMTGTTDQALFSSLIGLLQSWRQRGPSSDSGGNLGPQLGVPEMMSVLSLMQTDPPAVLGEAVSNERTSLAEQLRREVLAGARRLGIGGENLSLSDVQEDAVDLVGMLFDVLLDERDFEPAVRQKIGRMLVPYVKVAVKDRRLFLYKGHPARRFLNAVAEACEGNHGEGPQERQLLDHVDLSIDRVVAEFNEDVAIFETLEQELRTYMAQHRQRIEIAERRAAETQRGRERLELARARSAKDIAARCDGRQLPPVLDDFITRFVAHHLTQVALRDGAESTQYAEALGVLQGVMVAFDHAELGATAEHQPTLDGDGLARILSSSGCTGTAAEDAIAVISSCLAHVSSDEGQPLSVPQLPPTLVPEVPAPVATPALEVSGTQDQLEFDPEVAERMRALMIGTWLQLVGENGRAEPAKVSWVSPISSRFLFVNRRGIRVLVASAEELAAMVRQGKLQLRQADTAFDDALHQMLGRLKSGASAA